MIRETRNFQSAPEPSSRPLLRVAAATLAVAAAAGFLLQKRVRAASDPKQGPAQALTVGAAILCLSVALDSGIEHYRARYDDRVMLFGPSMALIGLVAAGWVAAHPDRANERLPKLAFGTVAVTGLIGLGFHSYNILKRPGELSALNIFYGAPAGAPAALSLAGLYGLIAGAIADNDGQVTTRLAKATGGLVALSLLGTVAEAGILHFRGAFQNPAMYAPVTIPPLAAIAIGASTVSPGATGIARPLLKATAVLGIAGPIFHAYGIHRNMGGWRNWSQMILQGPPLPAPPAFLGIAIAGLGLLPELERKQR
jgi:hypothetical protein